LLSTHFILIICCIVSLEVMLATSLFSLFDNLATASKKTVKVLSSYNISDHWKEKAIPHYSLVIFKSSSLAFCILLSNIAIFYCGTVIDNTFSEHFFSILGIIESALICFVYIKIKKLILE